MDARHSSDQVHTKTLETLDDFASLLCFWLSSFFFFFCKLRFHFGGACSLSSMRSFANLRISRVRTHTHTRHTFDDAIYASTHIQPDEKFASVRLQKAESKQNKKKKTAKTQRETKHVHKVRRHKNACKLFGISI